MVLSEDKFHAVALSIRRDGRLAWQLGMAAEGLTWWVTGSLPGHGGGALTVIPEGAL